MSRRLRSEIAKPPVARKHIPRLSPLDLAGLVLIAIRWFTPTEGTFRGDTLWIAQLWLGWAALAAWQAFRERRAWSCASVSLIAGVVLLTAGHVVSALVVLGTEGQKRAALNGFWEWLAIGGTAIWFVHRARAAEFRTAYRTTLIVACSGLAGLGLWQRWVSQPTLGRAVVEFDELERQIPTLSGLEQRTAERRLAELQQTVGPEYTSLDEAGRRAMRQRLLESTEPLGRFALANSFAAILLVALILALGQSRWSPSPSGFGRLVVVLLLAFVFVLTKSRTAWVGAGCGGLIALALSFDGRWRRALLTTMLALGVAGMMFLVAWAAGGLDRLVVSEAPKSLEYRTEYWIGTWKVIAEHPLLGVGPGNFRQNYLKHKLEKSSEEVLDPHNFILEAWATGGLLALAGLAVVMTSVGFAWRRSPSVPAADEPFTPVRSVVVVLSGVGVTLVLKGLLLDGFFDSEFAMVLAGSLAALWLWTRGASESVIDLARGNIATSAASAALSVHLLGAGGMEMPAIIQLWLCLAALVVAAATGETERCWPKWSPAAATTLAIVGFFGQLATATVPSMTSRATVELAAADARLDWRPKRISEQLLEAAAADPLDPDPWRRRAQTAFAEWRRSRQDEDFETAVTSQREAIRRDPQHAHDYQALADIYLGRWKLEPRAEDAAAAVDAMTSALARYPNSVVHRRTYAEALAAADRPADAAVAAKRALELHRLCEKLGHLDKALPPPDIARMKAIAGEP